MENNTNPYRCQEHAARCIDIINIDTQLLKLGRLDLDVLIIYCCLYTHETTKKNIHL